MYDETQENIIFLPAPFILQMSFSIIRKELSSSLYVHNSLPPSSKFITSSGHIVPFSLFNNIIQYYVSHNIYSSTIYSVYDKPLIFSKKENRFIDHSIHYQKPVKNVQQHRWLKKLRSLALSYCKITKKEPFYTAYYLLEYPDLSPEEFFKQLKEDDIRKIAFYLHPPYKIEKADYARFHSSYVPSL